MDQTRGMIRGGEAPDVRGLLSSSVRCRSTCRSGVVVVMGAGERMAKKSDDKYLRVQSEATSIVRKEIVPLGDKLRLVALFRILGSLTRIYAPLYWSCQRILTQ
jgi:hypothetical protein